MTVSFDAESSNFEITQEWDTSGKVVTLTASAGYEQYTWTYDGGMVLEGSGDNGEQLVFDTEVYAVVPGTYIITVTATDSEGKADSAYVTVKVE